MQEADKRKYNEAIIQCRVFFVFFFIFLKIAVLYIKHHVFRGTSNRETHWDEMAQK